MPGLPLICHRRPFLALSLSLLLLLPLLYTLLPSHWPSPTLSPPLRPRAPLPYHESFEYILNSPICGNPGSPSSPSGASEPLRAVVVVHSDPRRPEVRDAIRQSLPSEELRRLGVRRAFMVADASTRVREGEKTVLQSAIVAENDLHGDLVQGNFHDSYHNLTYKHIMALDWATIFCPQARHIIKMDDDIVYNLYALLETLSTLPIYKYLGGNAFPAALPFRGDDSKWRVSNEEWPRAYYPPYVSGWLYIVTQDVARALVLQSTVVPFFWIDDTFVTGILAEQLPITITPLNRLFATLPDCVKDTVTQSKIPTQGEPPPADLYAPSFVVGPTDRDLDVLKGFNRLCRHCEQGLCGRRKRAAVCRNHFDE